MFKDYKYWATRPLRTGTSFGVPFWAENAAANAGLTKPTTVTINFKSLLASINLH